MIDLIQALASELGQKPEYVENVVRLLDEGNTIPFIARYRKELHGAMDDTVLRNLETRLAYLRSLQERRETILAAIELQGKLDEALRRSIEDAATLAELEDLYRPYKPKRRTRATIAQEKGLEALADLLFAQGRDCGEPLAEAAAYVNEDKGVATAEEALRGASDIIAERISDDASLRASLRALRSWPSTGAKRRSFCGSVFSWTMTRPCRPSAARWWSPAAGPWPSSATRRWTPMTVCSSPRWSVSCARS